MWLDIVPGKGFLVDKPFSERDNPPKGFDSQFVVHWCPVCNYGLTSSGECDLCSVDQKQQDQNRLPKKRKDAVDNSSFKLSEDISPTLLHVTDWHDLDPKK